MKGWLHMKFYLTALSIFTADECLKRTAEKRRNAEERTVLSGKVILRSHHNKGICLNLFDRRPDLVAFFSVLLTAAAAVRVFQVRKNPSQKLYAAGLSLVLGGALSNTWDRIHRKYVVDYFSFNCRWKWLRNLVFNLSDLCIFAGSLAAVIGRKN